MPILLQFCLKIVLTSAGAIGPDICCCFFMLRPQFWNIVVVTVWIPPGLPGTADSGLLVMMGPRGKVWIVRIYSSFRNWPSVTTALLSTGHQRKLLTNSSEPYLLLFSQFFISKSGLERWESQWDVTSGTSSLCWVRVPSALRALPFALISLYYKQNEF